MTDRRLHLPTCGWQSRPRRGHCGRRARKAPATIHTIRYRSPIDSPSATILKRMRRPLSCRCRPQLGGNPTTCCTPPVCFIFFSFSYAPGSVQARATNQHQKLSGVCAMVHRRWPHACGSGDMPGVLRMCKKNVLQTLDAHPPSEMLVLCVEYDPIIIPLLVCVTTSAPLPCLFFPRAHDVHKGSVLLEGVVAPRRSKLGFEGRVSRRGARGKRGPRREETPGERPEAADPRRTTAPGPLLRRALLLGVLV